MQRKSATLYACLLVFASCVSVRESTKYNFSDGMYKSTNKSLGARHFRVDVEEDSIMIRPVIVSKTVVQMLPTVYYPSMTDRKPSAIPVLRKNSFDFDFLTIPLKFRPALSGIPPQLNTTLNGAVYMGYRTDIFKIFYKDGGARGYERKMTHYGLSFGGFTGIGSTPMNPTVTLDRITIEYDGVVWSKGIAAILGIDRLTIGLVLGFDTLLDSNNSFWVYSGKPWVGLGFGLNLN